MQRPRFAAPLGLSKRRVQEKMYDHRRSEFERDRDRILYSASFRRLAGKTQVFPSRSHDHIRTRLSHTLEVSQIARAIASQLELDQLLAEAIALGHDLGHTPFGHVGERTLNLIMNGCLHLTIAPLLRESERGFKHNLQSVRAATELLDTYPRVPGLNITNFTVWGIRNHAGLTWSEDGSLEPACPYRDGHREVDQSKCRLTLDRAPCQCPTGLGVGFYDSYDRLAKRADGREAWSFEAIVVRFADSIAQRHHDLEDGLIAGLITQKEVVEQLENAYKEWMDKEDRTILGRMKRNIGTSFFAPYASKLIVSHLSKSLVRTAGDNLAKLAEEFDVKSAEDFGNCYLKIDLKAAQEIISVDIGMAAGDAKLREFLKGRILNSHQVHSVDGTGSFLIRKLFNSYMANPQQLTDRTLLYLRRALDQNPDLSIDSRDPSDIGEWRNRVKELHNADDRAFQVALLRTICDYISAMTDNYALRQYQQLYGHSHFELMQA